MSEGISSSDAYLLALAGFAGLILVGAIGYQVVGYLRMRRMTAAAIETVRKLPTTLDESVESAIRDADHIIRELQYPETGRVMPWALRIRPLAPTLASICSREPLNVVGPLTQLNVWLASS